MARSFNGSQYLSKSIGALLSAWPITIYCQSKSTNTSATQMAFIYQQLSPSNFGQGLAFLSGTSHAFVRTGGGNYVNGGAYSSGVWYSRQGRSRADADFDINVDNTVTAGAGSVTYLAAADYVFVGARDNGSITQPLTGDVANVAIWDVALSDAECKSLNAGFSPRRIRPANLRLWAPLVRETIAPVGGGTWNDAGAGVSAHPRSYGI